MKATRLIKSRCNSTKRTETELKKTLHEYSILCNQTNQLKDKQNRALGSSLHVGLLTRMQQNRVRVR